jgi:uncharacterized OB-fold protein
MAQTNCKIKCNFCGYSYVPKQLSGWEVSVCQNCGKRINISKYRKFKDLEEDPAQLF